MWWDGGHGVPLISTNGACRSENGARLRRSDLSGSLTVPVGGRFTGTGIRITSSWRCRGRAGRATDRRSSASRTDPRARRDRREADVLPVAPLSAPGAVSACRGLCLSRRRPPRSNPLPQGDSDPQDRRRQGSGSSHRRRSSRSHGMTARTAVRRGPGARGPGQPPRVPARAPPRPRDRARSGARVAPRTAHRRSGRPPPVHAPG